MTKLRQVNIVSHRANWTEYFYDGELKVVNGETETDNPVWIQHLRLRGFKPLDEIPQNVKTLGKIRGEETEESPVEPLGTQVAAAADTETEFEHVEELIEESESHPPVDQETVETVNENSIESVPSEETNMKEENYSDSEMNSSETHSQETRSEPTDLELMLQEAMGKRTPPPPKTRSRRRTPKKQQGD
jgi:hypothetical protein